MRRKCRLKAVSSHGSEPISIKGRGRGRRLCNGLEAVEKLGGNVCHKVWLTDA